MSTSSCIVWVSIFNQIFFPGCCYSLSYIFFSLSNWLTSELDPCTTDRQIRPSLWFKLLLVSYCFSFVHYLLTRILLPLLITFIAMLSFNWHNYLLSRPLSSSTTFLQFRTTTILTFTTITTYIIIVIVYCESLVILHSW